MKAERIEKIKNLVLKRQLDLTVVLENVTDLHNLGAVIRTCDAVGIAEVYLIYSEKKYRPRRFKVGKNTSSGARKWVDVKLYYEMDKAMQQIKRKYKRIWATALNATAKALYQCDFTLSGAVMFGNESIGLSEQALRYADDYIYIPQMGMVQSLNISVACAVCLYEAQRQRHKAGLYSCESLSGRLDLYTDYMERSKKQHSGEQMIICGQENHP